MGPLKVLTMFTIHTYVNLTSTISLLQIIIGEGRNCDDFVYVENVVHGHICAERTLSTMEGAKISGGKVYVLTVEWQTLFSTTN